MNDPAVRLAYYRQEYTRNRLKKRAVGQLQQDYEQYRRLAQEWGSSEDDQILQDLYYRIQSELRKLEQGFKSDCPIAYMQPSWHQANLLNAWHPDYESHLAPDGYQSILDVSTVRGAKDLANGTMVATPSGYTAIEKLSIGDFVLGKDGTPVRVTGVFPQGVQQMEKVSFSDGTVSYCSKNHLWSVMGQESRYSGGRQIWRVKRTEELIRSVGRIPKSNRRFSIPRAPVVQFEKKILPLNPWLLGALIGDGGLSLRHTVTFSSKDGEIIDRVAKASAQYGCFLKKRKQGCDYGISANFKGNYVLTTLQVLGLMETKSQSKFIPEDYKTSDIHDRQEILRGLMDTDGTCTERGYASFCSTSERLAYDVAEVARSLGCDVLVKKRSQKYKDGYCIHWKVGFRNAPFDLFFLSRKRDRHRGKKKNNKQYIKFIDSIEESVLCESTCISIDAEDGLFLLKDGIVTHNTYGLIMSMVLWMIPNDPDWPFFDEYEHPKFGKYRVLPRFDWDEWQRSGRRVFKKEEPPKSACEMWLGCVDENHYLSKIEPKWRKLIPAKYVRMREDGQLCWYKSEKTLETKFGTKLTAKLYNSDMTAWSGTELFFIGFDEGPTEDKVDEAVFRSQYMHIAFTPREAANIGQKAALAKKIYKGEKKLVGKLKVFQSKMEDTEDYILGDGNAALGAKKKQERIAIAATMGDAGRVAVEGGFFDSSPVVFSNFKPAFNILPITGDILVRAVRGESYPEELKEWPWLNKLLNANMLRGFDEGIAHPTAVVWGALLRTGERIIYRDYEASDTSITERVERIVDLSGNRLEKINLDALLQRNHDAALHYAPMVQGDRVREQMTGQRSNRFREVWVREPIRRTFADSKIFKRDPAHPLDDWTENYRRAGLTLDRAKSDGPSARCDLVNTLLRPDHTREHLNPVQGGQYGYGAGLYLTRDCVTLRKRLEEYLWEQFKTGPKVGQFTGKPAALGDDLIDSTGYLCGARITWVDPSQYKTSIAHT